MLFKEANVIEEILVASLTRVAVVEVVTPVLAAELLVAFAMHSKEESATVVTLADSLMKTVSSQLFSFVSPLLTCFLLLLFKLW